LSTHQYDEGVASQVKLSRLPTGECTSLTGIFPVRIVSSSRAPLYLYLSSNPNDLKTSPIRDGSGEGIADMTLPRHLIKRWNMFQTSSVGGNPEWGGYVRTPEVREFGSIFCLAANFTWDVPAALFAFSKQALWRFESPASRSSSFWLGLILWVWGFRPQGLLLALRMDALSTTFGSWILIASCSGQLIRASCLSSARQLDVLTLVSDPRDWTDAHSSRKPRALRVGNERGVLKKIKGERMKL
jgi:hypothetical protein